MQIGKSRTGRAALEAENEEKMLLVRRAARFQGEQAPIPFRTVPLSYLDGRSDEKGRVARREKTCSRGQIEALLINSIIHSHVRKAGRRLPSPHPPRLSSVHREKEGYLGNQRYEVKPAEREQGGPTTQDVLLPSVSFAHRALLP